MIKNITTSDVWQDQGYLTSLNVFSAREIKNYRSLFDELEATEGQNKSGIGLYNRHFNNRFVCELTTHSLILDCVQSVLGANVLLLSTHFFCKYPSKVHGNKFVAWHQDVTYWGLEPPQAATAWLAIDHVDRDNGCMRVVPGTHRQGILAHSKSTIEGNVLSINQEIPENSFDADQAVDLVLGAGQMSIHDGMLIHGSNPNHSNRRRCGLAIRYCPSHVKQRQANSLGKFFRAILVCGRDEYHHFPHREVPFG